MFINIIRWILLPFSCVLAYILTGIIANFFIGGYEGETIGYSRYAYTLGSFDVYWYGLIKNALMSSLLSMRLSLLHQLIKWRQLELSR